LTNGDFYTAAGDGVINCGGGIMNALINVIADFTPSPVVVNGDEDLYIQDDLELGSQGYKPGGGTWVAVSDMRLKKNIKPYKDGLNRILSINPVTYQYNNRMSTLNNGVTYVGVIAQEMKEIAPYTVEEKSFGEVTSEDENGKTVVVQQGENYYTFDPSALTYMLINAVRELNQKIADQQQELDQLKEMVDK
jgi:hypothetical protein